MSLNAPNNEKTGAISHKRLPAERRRRQLLDVALEVFATRGFDATSMEDIAEAAGVTKPLLYQHFDSKRALYLEIIRDVSMGLIGHVTSATSAAGSPRQQVEQGFSAYFAFVLQHRNAFRVLFGRSASHDEELSRAVKEVEKKIAETIAPLIDVGVSPEHRRLLAHAVIGMAEGASRYWMSGSNSRAENEISIDPAFTNKSSSELASWVADLAWAGLRGIKPEN